MRRGLFLCLKQEKQKTWDEHYSVLRNTVLPNSPSQVQLGLLPEVNKILINTLFLEFQEIDANHKVNNNCEIFTTQSRLRNAF